MILSYILGSAVPFTSLSILWKDAERNHFAEPNKHVLTFLHPSFFCLATYWAPNGGWGLQILSTAQYMLSRSVLESKIYLYIPEGRTCSIKCYNHLTGSILENWNSWVTQKLRVQRRNYYLLRWTVKEDRACQWSLHACQSGTPACKSSHWVSYRIVNIRW